jgi:hypothetical protein
MPGSKGQSLTGLAFCVRGPMKPVLSIKPMAQDTPAVLEAKRIAAEMGYRDDPDAVNFAHKILELRDHWSPRR